MSRASARSNAKQTALLLCALAIVGVIIWLDVATGVWQDVVVLSGLAAGLVTFLLTVLVLDRIMAKNTAKRWAPVTRIAFSEFLHTLADDDASEISRGEIVPRSLPQAPALTAPGGSGDSSDSSGAVGSSGAAGSNGVGDSSGTAASAAPAVPRRELDALREQVVSERTLLADTLSRWAQFLASSGDHETVLGHTAAIAWQLDLVRDAAMEAEREWNAETRERLDATIRTVNERFSALVDELRERLDSADAPPERSPV